MATPELWTYLYETSRHVCIYVTVKAQRSTAGTYLLRECPECGKTKRSLALGRRNPNGSIH